ncbi:MAG: cadherin-like beta sandwich domain-containing protein [Erysipelotrichales bacterium]|nr:cadherin-like beta sandwich domain-containing protein [Erysipelotrichales bacterium]
MKKFYVIILGLFMIVLPTHVYASSANISVSASNTVMVGNQVTVTVTLSSSSKIGSWQVDLSYDKNLLQLTNSNAEGGGTYMVNVAQNGTTSKKYTFTFKTLKAGSAKVSVNSYTLYDYNTMDAMQTTGSSKTISIKTKEEIEASYSSNAYLKSLSVGEYELKPAFNKETYEYNVEVENEIESITLSASKEDANATISGSGEKELVEGNNKFEIVVTAQKGNSLTYVVNVYRKELDPINININGKEYGVVRRADALPEFKTFTPTTVTYEDTEIPALYSEITGITLVGLKDEEGNVVTYFYEDNKITNIYIELNGNTYAITPLELKESDLFNNYKIKEVEINGVKVKAYILADDSKYAIIYGQNVENGDITYYSYSLTDGTFQVYDKDLIAFYEERIQNYKYILLGAIAVIFILLLIVCFRKTKKIKKNDNKYDASLVQTIENHIDEEIKEEIKNENEKKEETKEIKLVEKDIEESVDKTSEIKLVNNEESKNNKKHKNKKQKIRNDFDF